MQKSLFPALLLTLWQIASLSLAGPLMAATAPVVTEYNTPTVVSLPQYITSGSDGAMWFTELYANKIGRITVDGTATDFPVAGVGPVQIVSGPDGALWFTGSSGNTIGRITTAGIVTEFNIPTANSNPFGMVSDATDGAVWFTEYEGNRIGRITTAGIITEFVIPTAGARPISIVVGPDGALWFDEQYPANKIGRITTSGTITEFPLPGSSINPGGITVGPDGALWFFDSAGLARITTTGVISEFSLGSSASGYQVLTLGPDGALWFGTDNSIGRAVISGSSPVVTAFSVGNGSFPTGVAPGPDGAMWFAQDGTNQIGRITIPTNTLTVTQSSQEGGGQGLVTSSSLGQASLPGLSCTSGGTGCSFAFPSGNLVTLSASASAGSVFEGWSGGGCSGTGTCTIMLAADTAVIAVFEPTPTAALVSVTVSGNGTGTIASNPSGIACGSTCNASFALNTPITLTASPSSGSTFIGWSGGGCSGIEPCTITFTQATTIEHETVINANFVANSNSDVTLVSALLPTSRSVQVGATATFFGTMINASSDTAGSNCTVAPTTSIPATFSFQATNASTNAPTGTSNTPVTIAAGASQSFVLALTPVSTIAPTQVAFSFTCSNATAAPSDLGLNTLLLSASATPTPDVIALAATLSNDGIVDIPGVTGTGAFAVATANVGSASAITASANSGTANLPVAITICQTNPISGQCFESPAASTALTINAGDTPTFSIFIKANGTVPFLPATNRIFMQFQDAGGSVRGSTSVAVRTQ